MILTSKRPKKVNFRAMELKFPEKYAGSDTEISGAKKEEINFPTYAWVLLIASHMSEIFWNPNT